MTNSTVLENAGMRFEFGADIVAGNGLIIASRLK
jgi:hypothetical protein